MSCAGAGGDDARDFDVRRSVGYVFFDFDAFDALKEVHGGVVFLLVFDDGGEFRALLKIWGCCGGQLPRQGYRPGGYGCKCNKNSYIQAHWRKSLRTRDAYWIRWWGKLLHGNRVTSRCATGCNLSDFLGRRRRQFRGRGAGKATRGRAAGEPAWQTTME